MRTKDMIAFSVALEIRLCIKVSAVSSQNARVSLCMIVRDGERSIARALTSGRRFADELIVVDTGSTDGTHEIAQKLDAKIVQFAWCDDFAAARNYSLDQATGDWI